MIEHANSASKPAAQTSATKKPYVPPQLSDLDSVECTAGKGTNPGETTFVGPAS